MKRATILLKFRAVLAMSALGVLVTWNGAFAADIYPALLPPEDTVKGTLTQLPEVRAARAELDLAAAEAKRLRAGPYEWTASATVQRRTETNGTRYRETGLGVERALRSFGKAGKDAEIGEQKIRRAEYAYADAWHEAGREFLKSWFDALREARSAALLAEQLAVHEQQVGIVARRVRAGDAPRMDLLLAEAERDRAAASQSQAARRAARLASVLAQRYPGLRLAAPEPLPDPQPMSKGADEWVRSMLAENHEINLADANAAVARLSAQRNSMDRMPDPTVGVHMMQERDRQEKIVGVTISIPIPGGARRAQGEASAAEAAIAQEKAEQVRRRVSREAGSTALAAEAAHENWERLSALSARSKDTAALMAKAYSLGEVPIGEALLARRQALESAAAAESAQIDALEAQARLMLDAHVILESDAHGEHGQ